MTSELSTYNMQETTSSKAGKFKILFPKKKPLKLPSLPFIHFKKMISHNNNREI